MDLMVLDLKVLDLDQQLMVLQMVKVRIRRNLEIKTVARQMVLIKLEGDEQLPVIGESDNNLAVMGVVVMGLMAGFATMNRR